MDEQFDPTKPIPNDEKFKPKNVAGSGKGKGRDEHGMHDTPRGSEGEGERKTNARHNEN